MFAIKAINLKTDEVIILGEFQSYEESKWNIDNNIEWDEEDNPADWEISVIDRYENYYDNNIECGFDPYMGCYSDDC